jgi:RimJ/RimL family protein N-acetyltransferase
MSSQDVYMRFFRRVSALSYEEAQRLCNVDFDKDVAFVAVTGPRDNEEVVGTGAYFLNPSTNLAEVAYMIVPELQGSGLDRGVRGFVAEVLETNAAMLNLARRLGNIDVKSEDGTYHVTALFA